MKVTYKPDDDMPKETEQYGHRFVAGKPVDITDAKHLMKFRGNPWFMVEDEAPVKAKAEAKA